MIFQIGLIRDNIYFIHTNVTVTGGYFMLKIFVQVSSMGQQVDNELNMYKHMEQSPTAHPGRDVIRSLLDAFLLHRRTSGQASMPCASPIMGE